MIHEYKKYLQDIYSTLSQPNMSELPWKFSRLDASFFDIKSQRVFPVSMQYDNDIIICDVLEFFRRYSSQAQKYLFTALKTDSFDNQWNMHAHVYAQKQWIVYVMPGIYIKEPIILDLDNACIEHITIIVGRGAQVIIHEKMFAKQGMRIKNVDVILEQDAHLTFIAEHNDAQDMLVYVYYRFFVYQDAQLTGNFALLGGKHTMTMIDVEMCAPGAQAEIKGLYVLDKERQSIVSTRQRHNYKRTMSNVIMKGIVSDTAHTVYHGTIAIAKNAPKTEAYQENKNMVLGNMAKVFSQPNLEIQTDDVRCKHGSAIGNFDTEQLLYVQSRGLSLHIAQKLLLNAFISDVLHPMINIRSLGFF